MCPLQDIGDCLSCVTTLRVLMLGKNRIKSIANIDRLAKLDVLDLHSNQVTKVSRRITPPHTCMQHVTRLMTSLWWCVRVVAVGEAGHADGAARAEPRRQPDQVRHHPQTLFRPFQHRTSLTSLVSVCSVVENLSNLRSLTELNLRRNHISAVHDLHPLPVLQRVFLSNNCLTSLEAATSLFGVRYLVELALDGNPIATQNPAAYRRYRAYTPDIKWSMRMARQCSG